ncbi:hypothetical protein ACQWKR_23770, partial [Salmonella enterica subsp. enterica serovar Infantis]
MSLLDMVKQMFVLAVRNVSLTASQLLLLAHRASFVIGRAFVIRILGVCIFIVFMLQRLYIWGGTWTQGWRTLSQ